MIAMPGDIPDKQRGSPMPRTTLLLFAVALLAGGGLATAPTAMAQATTAPAMSADERELFALNIYHEARSEGRDGMIAVGWVVLNRIADPVYPDSVTGVVNQRRGGNCEWGWTCDGRSDQPTEADMWALAQEVADLMAGPDRPADPTSGALWFHETFRAQPGWMGSQVRRTTTLGNHHFYARS